MTSGDVTQLRQQYESAGQGHVFQFWDDLSSEDKESLLSQLAAIDPHRVTKVAETTLKPHSANGVLNGMAEGAVSPTKEGILPLPREATASLMSEDPAKISHWNDLGLAAIAQNKVAVVLLAGGQGTRLGSSLPKGCYDVGLPSHKTLFQLQAERIIRLCQLASKHPSRTGTSDIVIPWYIMTSGPTRRVTEDFFLKNKYFGLDPSNVVFFEQGTLPCLTEDGKIILETKSRVAVAPDGNGGIYHAIYKSGALDNMKQRGIEHIHTYCVDNCLVKVADPVFIGFSMERNVEIATKVVRKRDVSEKVGLIVSKLGAPAVVEYSEISPAMASKTEVFDDTLLKFRAANIVNHYYSAKFLFNIPNWETSYLPFHIARKKITYVDLATGVITKPAQPNGIKLEQFVFDVFPRLAFSNFASLEVSRQDEFSPLKNGPGTGQDCPETSRSDVLAQSARFLEAAGAVVEGDVEVSPLTSYGGEGLESFSGKHIAAQSIL